MGENIMRHWSPSTPTENKNPKPLLILWGGFGIFILSRLTSVVDSLPDLMPTADMKQIKCLICRKPFPARNNIQRSTGKGTCRPKCYAENRRRLQIKRRLTGTQGSIKLKPRSAVRQLAVRKGRKARYVASGRNPGGLCV